MTASRNWIQSDGRTRLRHCCSLLVTRPDNPLVTWSTLPYLQCRLLGPLACSTRPIKVGPVRSHNFSQLYREVGDANGLAYGSVGESNPLVTRSTLPYLECRLRHFSLLIHGPLACSTRPIKVGPVRSHNFSQLYREVGDANGLAYGSVGKSNPLVTWSNSNVVCDTSLSRLIHVPLACCTGSITVACSSVQRKKQRKELKCSLSSYM